MFDNTGFDSWMSDIRLLPAEKDMGLGQIRMGIRQYNAVFDWQRWPWRQVDPDLLLCALLVWRDEQANDYYSQLELDAPDVNIEPTDDNIAEVTVSMPLADPIILIPDEVRFYHDGRHPLPKLDKPEIWVAENITVSTIRAGK
ncbi:phage tail protein [Escherichia coli]|nr:phage tail protein [Escherichia coli]